MLDDPSHDRPFHRIDAPRLQPDCPANAPVRIVILGAIRMDLLVKTRQMPRPGRSIQARSFAALPGGKGANQAIAAARLQADAHLIGCVGDDPYGRQLLDWLRRDHVNISHVRTTQDRSSGLALIHVDESGDNAITLVSGANAQLCPDDINALESLIAGADALLCQLEVPLSTICAAIRLARKHRVLTIVDPAPAPSGGLPDDLFNVDVLSPNRSEAESLTGESAARVAQAKLVAVELVRRGARQVVLKMAGDGAVIVNESGLVQHIPAYRTHVADPTAVGDAFTAALAIGLAEGRPIDYAARMGCAAGALAVRTFGAAAAMPSRQAVLRLMRSRC